MYALNYPRKSFKQKVKFVSDQHLSKVLHNGKSIIRFGDGEINILLDITMPYHNPDVQLKKALLKMVSTYSTQDTFLMAIPEQITHSNYDLSKARGLPTESHHPSLKKIWLPFKVMYFLLFPKDQWYADAHMFHPGLEKGVFQRIVLPILKKKSLIFVTKKETIEKIKNSNVDSFENVFYVETPARNAFCQYEKIKHDIMQIISQDKNKFVVLFALGPAGKVMAQELSEESIQCLDIGKGMEFLFSESV
jgi:hypothetical protein